MRKPISLIALAAALSLAGVSTAQTPTQRHDFCYMSCQYQCYAVHPGGGPAWTQCYLDCATAQCGRVN
jgi:hypothetical protein